MLYNFNMSVPGNRKQKYTHQVSYHSAIGKLFKIAILVILLAILIFAFLTYQSVNTALDDRYRIYNQIYSLRSQLSRIKSNSWDETRSERQNLLMRCAPSHPASSRMVCVNRLDEISDRLARLLQQMSAIPEILKQAKKTNLNFGKKQQRLESFSDQLKQFQKYIKSLLSNKWSWS